MKITQELLELIESEVDAGYVRKKKHPVYPINIYTYSQTAQYEKRWNQATRLCRGLILDEEGVIIARPFEKFFNRSEHEAHEIPVHLDFKVYEKEDGSLGIIYHYDGKWNISTKGGFTSEQAIKAEKMLYEMYPEAVEKMIPDNTYLTEIIYPENRIVVDYHGQSKLILLSVIERCTGVEHELDDFQNLGLPLVKRYGFKQLGEIMQEQSMDREGYIVRFSNGFRYKEKFTEYLRLHRIVTEVSNKSIWEYLMSGNHDMNEILDRVPDEFYDWVKKTKDELVGKYKEIENAALDSLAKVMTIIEHSDDPKVMKKNFAMEAQKHPNPHLLFMMYNDKDYSEAIWKMVRPEFARPFTKEEEQ